MVGNILQNNNTPNYIPTVDACVEGDKVLQEVLEY